MNTEALIDMLKRHEGVRLKPYMDTVGKLTIGCGRNLDDIGISEAEMEFLLENDIASVTIELSKSLPWWNVTLNDARQLVLANMCFNLGITRLLGFKKFLEAARLGDYEKAAVEMLDSLWAEQVGARATELAGIMRIGKL